MTCVLMSPCALVSAKQLKEATECDDTSHVRVCLLQDKREKKNWPENQQQQQHSLAIVIPLVMLIKGLMARPHVSNRFIPFIHLIRPRPSQL